MSSWPSKTDRDRGQPFIRQWRLLLLLRSRRVRLETLASELGCCTRTIRRDLVVLAAAGVPIRQTPKQWTGDETLFYVGECAAWPRNELTPVDVLRREARA